MTAGQEMSNRMCQDDVSAIPSGLAASAYSTAELMIFA